MIMEVVRLGLAALVLASATFGTHLDQYVQQDGSGVAAEATDHPSNNLEDLHNHHHHHHKFTAHSVPELQVGCEGDEQKATATKKKAAKRRRRGFYEWQGTVVRAPSNPSFTVWQPPVYQLSRPYFIPVFGSEGRLPIYFPPQPILINSPYPPPDRSGYLPPKGYLPPDPSETSSTTQKTMKGDDSIIPIVDRLLEDDAPIWDVEPQAAPPTTPAPSNMIPTRRRRPNSRTTLPPLVHSASNSNANSLSPQQQLRPPQERPSVIPPPPSTPPRQQPSRCVWAIISCCQAGTGDVSTSCFEQLGCPGAFWDSSPCNTDFAKAAIDVAMKYYNTK